MPSLGLGLFRIVFGALMVWEVVFLYRIDFLGNFVRGPATLFNYDFLPIEPIGGPVLDWLLAGLLISAVLITIGYRVRWALVYFFLVFTYFFLLDKG